MYDLLRGLNLQDPFLVEYLLGNINKKIAATILKFINPLTPESQKILR